MAPEDIPLGYYTHINFAFAYIDPSSYTVSPMASDVAALYQQVSGLKSRQSDLQVWISIGGWSFNDPGPTASTFSDLAGSTSAQSSFFSSVISFLRANNFDGVDLDWYVLPQQAQPCSVDMHNANIRVGNIRLPRKGVEGKQTWKTMLASCRHSALPWMLEVTDYQSLL